MVAGINNIRRSLIWLVVALLLAACGGGDQQAQEPAAPQAATDGTAEPASGAAAGASTAAAEPAGSGDTPQGDATLNIALSADPPSLDPAASSALVDRQVHNSLYDKLLDLDASGKIVPMLATKHTVSEDGLTYTFTLREGVKFHDGTPFNAEAVKFNIERSQAEDSPRANELQAVKSVQVVNPTTVKLTLSEPFAPLLSVLTDRSGMMVSPTAAKKLGKDFLTKPVGTGPFTFQKRITGDSITLVRNGQYWRTGFPKAKQVVYRVFEDANTALVNLRSGQVDFTDTLPSKEVPGLEKDAQFKVYNQPGLGYQGIYLNTKAKPFDNKNVRKAVDMMIDREALVKALFGTTAIPGHSPFAKSHFAYGESDKYPKPDAAAAKKLLADAGMSNVTFTMKTGTAVANTQLAALVQNFLKPAGITMQIEKLEFGTLLEQSEAGNFQAVALGWSGRTDPDQNIYDFIVTGGRNNDSGYSNPTVDKQLNIGRQESDPAKRKAAYDKVMAILHEDVPYVYLYHTNNVFGSRAGVTGFQYAPDGIIRTVNMSKQS